MDRNQDVELGDTTRKSFNGAPSGPPPPEIDEAELNFQPKTLKFWTVIVSIFLALFLVALDRTIVSTAVPAITQEFNSMGDIGWYGSAYQLTTAASQLIFGRIYKFYDIKRTFLVSMLIFEVGAAMSGAASSSVIFIVGRAIAGLGGAGIFSGVMIIMIPLIPLRKRPMFQGMFGAVFGLASVLGPLVGGAFTSTVTWRWCFFLGLPVGCFAAACVIFVLHLPHKAPSPARPIEHFTRLDPLGTFFFVPSVVCLLLTLQWGGSVHAWNSWQIILLFCIFGLGMIAFGAVQVLMPNTATVPVRIIKRRSIYAGAMFMFCLAGSMLLIIFFLPLWFQIVQGVSPLQSGVNTLPFVISMVVATIFSGAVTAKIGYYVPAMLLCPTIMALGQGLMSTFGVVEPTARWIGFEIIAGFGLGLGMQASNLAAQAVLPKPDIPTGIAIMFFAQQLGGAIFTSVGQNLLSTTLAAGLVGIPGLDPTTLGSKGAADLVSSVPPEYRLQVREVYNHGLNRIFLCGLGVACVGILAAALMEWKNIKKTGPNAPGAMPPKDLPQPSTRSTLPVPDDSNTVSRTTLHHREGSECSFLGVETGVDFAKTMTDSQIFSNSFPVVDGGKQSEFRATTPPAECDKCGNCRLSRAVTIAPAFGSSNQLALDTSPARSVSHAASAVSSASTVSAAPPRRSAEQMSTSQALGEYARLAVVAREALTQMEDLKQSFVMLTGTKPNGTPLHTTTSHPNFRHHYRSRTSGSNSSMSSCSVNGRASSSGVNSGSMIDGQSTVVPNEAVARGSWQLAPPPPKPIHIPNQPLNLPTHQRSQPVTRVSSFTNLPAIPGSQLPTRLSTPSNYFDRNSAQAWEDPSVAPNNGRMTPAATPAATYEVATAIRPSKATMC